MALIIKGLDLSRVKAKKQEQRTTLASRTLILDGDGPAYRAAATVKRLDTAIRRFQTDVLTQMAMTGCGQATVHLTHRTSHKNGRKLVPAWKPYQGSRKGKSKPALLEPLRDAMALRENWLPEFTVVMHYELEADDGMIIQAHQLRDLGVIWSDDKDLMCTPYLYYRQDQGCIEGAEPHGWIAEKFTPGGQHKVVGRGPLFFWAQMLMGDTADHIQGIHKLNGRACGSIGAYDFLSPIRDRDEAANAVIGAYIQCRQNVVAEAWLLHLLQHPRDDAQQYLESFDLHPLHREYVQECGREVKEAMNAKASPYQHGLMEA